MNTTLIAGGAMDADDLLDDYLDHVCAPLVGRVGYRERQTVRASVREQADAIASDATRRGASASAAMRAALRSLGPASRHQHAAMAGHRASERTSRFDRLSGLLALVAVAGAAGFYVNHAILYGFGSDPTGDWINSIAAIVTVLVVWRCRLGLVNGAVAGWLLFIVAWPAYWWYCISTMAPQQAPPLTVWSTMKAIPGLTLASSGNIVIGCVAGYLVARAHRLAHTR